MNYRKAIWVFVLVAMLMTGCYFQEDVQANQVAITLEKNKITGCLGPGVYSDGSWWAEMKVVNIDTLTFSVEDPEVLTSDKQPVGVKITIQARRLADCEATKNIFTNWSTLTDDANFVNTISATAREGMKIGVNKFKLDQLLNDRNGLATAIIEQLEEDTQKYSGEIINVTVENISVDPAYMATLNETAQFQAQIDKEKQRQELIKQQASTDIIASQQQVLAAEAQVLAEQAKTEVEVEIAKREGEKTAAAQEVYSLNPQAFELERLRLIALIYGDKTMFVPLDSNIFINPGNMVPLQ